MKNILKILLVVLNLITALPSLCQNVNFFSFGDDYQDTKGIVTEQKGNFFIIGNYGNSSFDAFQAQLNKDYSIKWSKSYRNGSNSDNQGFYIDENGNHYLSGTGDSYSSTLLLKTDSTGKILKSKKLGEFHDRLKSIHPLSDGNLLFYGELEGEVSGNNQLALYKTNKNLEPIWKKVISHLTSSDNDRNMEMYSRKILELADGSLVLLASLTDYVNPQSDRKIRLLKIDKDGNSIWIKGFSNRKADNPQSIALGLDDGFIICGISDSYSQGNGTDLQLIKVNKNGEVEWSKVYGGAGNDGGYHIIKTEDNGYLVGGVTDSFGKGKNDIFLLKIDNSGKLIWGKTFGGKEEEVITNFFHSNERIFLSGYSKSFKSNRYKTFLLELSALPDFESNCFDDVTHLVTVTDVFLSNSSHTYSGTTFPTPYDVNLDVSNLDLAKMEECLNCYQDQNYEVEVCNEEIVDAFEEGALSYLWENGAVRSSRQIKSPGSYSVRVNFGFCSITKTYEVDIKGSSKLSLGDVVTTCSGESVFLKPKEDLPNGSFKWSTGEVSKEIEVRNSGKYWLNYESDCGLVSDSVTVFFEKKPQIKFGNDFTLCKGEIAVLQPEFTGGEIKWNDGTTGISKKINGGGRFWASIENNCGISSDTVIVTPKSIKSPFIPNVFTPNRDGINDYFEIDYQLIGSTFKVFNRWGKMVFFSPSYENNWDGENLPAGTYFVTFTDHCTGTNYRSTLAIVLE